MLLPLFTANHHCFVATDTALPDNTEPVMKMLLAMSLVVVLVIVVVMAVVGVVLVAE